MSSIPDIPDDLLVEILIRLPIKSIIQCSLLCKRLYSLILHSNIIKGSFINHHRYHSQRLPLTLFFAYTYIYKEPFTITLPGEHEPPLPRQEYSVCYVFDLFHSSSVKILAMCDDLLLVSYGFTNFYVCNPQTKQLVILPKPPGSTTYHFSRGKYGLVCKSNNNFRIVIIICDVMTIFNSKTKKWSDFREVSIFLEYFFKLIACKGVLFSIVTKITPREDTYHLIVFDPFQDHPKFQFCDCYKVAAVHSAWSLHEADEKFSLGMGPVDCDCNKFSVEPSKPEWPLNEEKKYRLGMVQGRLRLSQLSRIDGHCFVLKIFELEDTNKYWCSPWILVNDIRLEAEKICNNMSVIAFHPDNGDVIFLLRDFEVYQYEIASKRYEKLNIKGINIDNEGRRRYSFHTSLDIYPVVHLPWPTIIGLQNHLY